MRIPKSIKVGGQAYRVLKGYVFNQDADLKGQADHMQLEIRLAGRDHAGEKIAQGRVDEYFWHEILHAITHNYGMHDLKESEIEILANGLHQVLTDNKLLKED